MTVDLTDLRVKLAAMNALYKPGALDDWSEGPYHTPCSCAQCQYVKARAAYLAALQPTVPALLDELRALRQERDALLPYRERAWRAETRADEKWALRREVEAILGVESGAAGDAQFAAGVTALKALVAERDALQSALKQSKALECMTCQAEAERAARIEADLALARAVLESVDESAAWVGDTVLLRAKAEPWRKWQRWRAQR